MDGSQAHKKEQLPLSRLEAQITALAGQLNAATHRWLVLIAEFDRRKGWEDGAFVSCAHWLNFKCGLDLGAAREKVRVAHALAGVPKISAAFACGQLSYSKVRAITRVADSSNEDYFLSVAIQGTAHHVERIVRHYRNARQEQALSMEASQQASRELSYWFDADGSLIIKARLPAVAGAALLNALKAAGDHLFKRRAAADANKTTTIMPNYAMQRADALALVAESFLAGGESGRMGGERYHVVVHVDAQTLGRDKDGRCEIESGSPIAAETARRLACNASRSEIIEDEKGAPLKVGRKTRTVPPAMRRALAARDDGCQFPGCTHQRYLDAHHIRHWAAGGATKLPNLLLLCRFHHRVVHEGGIRIKRREGGNIEFVRQDGRVFDSSLALLQPWEWRDLVKSNLKHGVKFDPALAAEDLLRRAEA